MHHRVHGEHEVLRGLFTRRAQSECGYHCKPVLGSLPRAERSNLNAEEGAASSHPS